MKTIWMCDFCDAKFETEKSASEHEEYCKWEKAGHSVWVEDGKPYHCPPIPEEVFGPHGYAYDGISDCSYGCGCWAGPHRSGGPVNPLGPCPCNYLGATKVRGNNTDA